ADCPDHPTVNLQLEQFDAAIEVAAKLGITPEVRHIANSAATLTKPSSHYDLVRPGIAVYGISPGPAVGTSRSLGLRPVMTLAARLSQVKKLPAGHGISYGHQYVTTADTTVGLVPVGYADGLPRASTNAGPVWAAGGQRIVAGRMCMDQFVIDLGNDDAWAGDEVVIFGPGTNGEPTADDWAAACETISYEIVSRIGPRIPRVFVGGL
ncbi:MAG: alanine racemase, partial [Actinomycetes bacterium]